MASTITAAERSITLSLTADEFLALLSENVELAEGIFRMLIATHDLATGHTLIHGNLPPDIKDAAHLRPVDRVLLLQSSPLLAHATAAQLWRLSAIAREATVAAGRRGAAQGQRGGDPDRAVGLAEGRRRRPAGTADSRRRDRHVRNAGRDRRSARRSRPTPRRTLLRIDRGGLFELLADHTDLLQGIFSMLLRRSGRTISNTVSTP